jgi:hypothetical protein
MTSTIHYDQATFFSQKQTRIVIAPDQAFFAPTLKMLDLEIVSDIPAYLPPTLGVYSLIKRIQVLVDGKIQDVNSVHAEYLPYVLPTLATNQQMKDKMSVIHGTGVVAYEPVSKKLTMKKVLVSTLTTPSYKFEVVLPLISNLLAQFGVVQQKVEIIIDFVDDIRSVLIPVTPGATIAAATVSRPYFSYECLQGDYKQASAVEFTTYIGDLLTVPACVADERQLKAIRTNAYNGKYLTKILVNKKPVSIATGAPNADALKIYQNFGKFVSIPQAGEYTNLAYDGNNLIDFNNINNPSFALALATMSFGESQAASLAHVHSVQSPLVELTDAALNGWHSYLSIEVGRKVTRDLVMQLYRVGRNGTNFPTLNEQLQINMVGLVRTALINGQKVYL